MVFLIPFPTLLKKDILFLNDFESGDYYLVVSCERFVFAFVFCENIVVFASNG